MKRSSKLILVAAVSLCAGSVVNASPFFDFDVVGSLTSGGTYTNSLTVTPGLPVYYEVFGQLAGSGTTNNTHNPAYTLGTQTSADGANSITFNLLDADTNANVAGGTLQTSWTLGQGTGALANGYYASQASSTFAGYTQTEILSGSFTAGSLSDSLTANDDFADEVNDGLKVVTTSGTKSIGDINITSQADAYFATPSGNALTLTVQTTPEPASLGLIALAVPALLARRRRRA